MKLAHIMAVPLSLLPVAALAQTSPSPFTTGMRYDGVGQLVGAISPDPGDTSTPHYPAMRTTYNHDGKPVKVESGDLAAWQPETVLPKDWPGFTRFRQVFTTYDPQGRKVAESQADADGNVHTLTQFKYDAEGRLECTAQRLQPAAGAPSTGACEQSVTVAPFDRITRNIYDAAGQLLQIRRGVGTSLEQAHVTYGKWDAATSSIKPGYTLNGKQEYVVDANGNTAKFVYDGFDRLAQWQFPSVATPPAGFNGATPATALQTAAAVNSSDYEEYKYDLNGNRTSQRKRDGREILYSYDSLNRPLSKIIPDACVSGYACTNVAANATRDVYYSHDLRGLQTAARFDSASGADAVINAYDNFGRLTGSTTSMGGASRTLSYQYDADGNRTRVTHPDSTWFGYEYDGLDRPVKVRENGTAIVVTMRWDVQGRRAGEGRSGVSTSYGYDAISRPTSIADDLAGTADDVTTSFGYNPASQITSRTLSNPGYAFSGYTNVSRAYAANGLNQYNSAGEVSFVYDANGNLTASGSTAYTYDAENRLVLASNGAGLIYDPLGRLFETSFGSGGVTRFLYDGDQLTLEYDASGNVLRRYVHGTGEDDPLLWYEGGGLSDRRSLQINHQNSIVSVAGTSGSAIEINQYDEYGIPAGRNIGRFQYTGQAWLPELGMYYYKARIYSPTLGRFLQTDPVGYDDQINLYAYVGDDPVNRRDPSGKYECTDGSKRCEEFLANQATSRARIAASIGTFKNAQANLLAGKKLTAGQAERIRVATQYLGKSAGTLSGIGKIIERGEKMIAAMDSKVGVVWDNNVDFMRNVPGMRLLVNPQAFDQSRQKQQGIAHEAHHEAGRSVDSGEYGRGAALGRARWKDEDLLYSHPENFTFALGF